MPDQNTLLLDNISKRYNAGSYVISEFSHNFEEGTATALLGPNGSGKTTLLRLLSVSTFPTSGSISYKNIDIHRHPHDYLSYVGIVYDQPDLPQYLTAVELLEWILRNRHLWNEQSSDDIDQLFNRLMLDERRNNLIGTYSSGMMKKTQIAASIIANPSILLMDEPFQGLDEVSKDATIELLKEFVSNDHILVISSHLKSTIESICSEYLHFPLS